MESLIAQIHKDKMNSICFDCGVENPKFVSVNNGIFLCNKCATVHMSFPQGVSDIENNDLYSLSENELKLLAEGGNTSLNNFILDEFPKLENYSQKLLYKTRAMDYYRKRLYYYVYGGIEPRRPSSIVGCQLIPDNNYTKNNYERNIPKKFEPKTKTYKPEEHVKSTKYKDEFDEFFNDPFMNPDKFGNEKDMFKKFFGKDFFGMDHDDFFDFDGKKNLNKTTYNPNPKTQYQYQERPKNQYISGYNDRNRNTNNYSNNTYNNNNYNSNTYNINEKQPMDNYSKKAGPYTSTNYVYRSQRPSAPSVTTVPSRKDKYMKRDVQNDNNDMKNNYNTEQINQNVNRGGTVNPMKYMKSSYRTQYSKPVEKEKEKEAEREKEREEMERKKEERERERERERKEREKERERKEREREREREEKEREKREREKERERDQEKREREKENQKENIKETQANRYNTNNNDNKKSYDPFKRRDSTDLITLPGMENNNLSQKNKKKQKPQEIPSEFSKQASGLGQIADAINENDNESISSQSNSISNSNSNSDSENNQDDKEFSEELKKIPEQNTHKKVENNNDEDDDITFKNSIRNKYKKRKSQIELEKKQEEEKLKAKAKARPVNNNTVYESKYNKKNVRNENNNNDRNIKKKPSKKNNEFKSKKSGGIHDDGANPQINKSYARRLSKMNITSSNWNINQLGDINTYPEVIEVEELIFY